MALVEIKHLLRRYIVGSVGFFSFNVDFEAIACSASSMSATGLGVNVKLALWLAWLFHLFKNQTWSLHSKILLLIFILFHTCPHLRLTLKKILKKEHLSLS